MRLLAVVLALLAAGCSVPAAPAQHLPNSIAALGDSITAAANTARDRIGESPRDSWAVGDLAEDGVTSHYERLVALHPEIEGHLADFARSGARMKDFAPQAQQAVDFKAEYVTVMFGANDICGGRNMTEPETFRAQFVAGAAMLHGLPPGARVLVVGVPNVTGIWERYHNVRQVRDVWSALRVCAPVLGANVTVAHREEARLRIDAYNAILAEESARAGFLFTNAVHDGAIEDADVGPVDFFHPSLAGQNAIANATWQATPWAR